MRGRAPVGASAGAPGRINADLGTVGGSPNTTAILNGTGVAAATLTTASLPAHSRGATFTPGTGGNASVVVHVSSDVATASQPTANCYLATGKGFGLNQPLMYRPDAGAGTVALNPASATIGGSFAGGTVAVGDTGSGHTVSAPVTVNVTGQIWTTPPFIGLNYIICVNGIYPSRP